MPCRLLRHNRTEGSDSRSGPMNPALEVLSRLLNGGIAWVILAALVISTAIPYGGGDMSMFLILAAVTVLMPIFILWPLNDCSLAVPEPMASLTAGDSRLGGSAT